MAKARFAHCVIYDIRMKVGAELKLPTPKGQTPAQFWSTVEQAGMLGKALEIYDCLAAEKTEQSNIRRETKKQFADRIEREGRQDEVDEWRTELLKAGESNRFVQGLLVTHFQPLDGSKTRVWRTPDPWKEGRLFKRKADQSRLLRLAEDRVEDDETERVHDAKMRVAWAKARRDERNALVYARGAWILSQPEPSTAPKRRRRPK
jgi:hypothetical protein